MSKLMLMDAKHPEETRVVIVDHDTIEDFDFVTKSKVQIKGNIYLAKITRVEPSLQAAFVEYGGGKQGFLPFSEIHPDYYQIPVEDRQRLIEEELEEAKRAEEEEEAEIEGRNQKRAEGGGGHAQGNDQAHRGRGRRRGRHKGRDFQRDANDSGEGENEQEFLGDSEEQDELNSDAHASDVDSEPTETQPLRAQDTVIASEVIEDEPESHSNNEAQSNQEEHQPQQQQHRHKSRNDRYARDDNEEGDEQEIETVSSDDGDERSSRRGSAFKRYRIQEVIKRNQIVLVQVIKEERGNKGCSLTTYLSLAGRYCVLMPNSPKGGGVSRKINNGEQRKMLKEMLAELRDKRGFPAIIRTAGLDRTKAEIKRDYEYLVKMWTQIREDTMASTAPSLIYEESDIIKRCLRDMYTEDIEHVLVQGADAYRDCKNIMKLIMPSHAPRIKDYRDDAPIFASYGVETQLASMYEPEVKLPSGGYIVIQATEALTSVDVNSGRSTTERNVEETAIKTNLEAAREVARQMRLRDVAGLIVIDFIDMYYGKNRRTLEKAMKDYLKHDRAKIQLGRISPFGLMELSRQRLRPSIAESSMRACDHCQGTGFVKSLETVGIQAIRLLEREAVMGDYHTLKLVSTGDVAMYLLNEKRPMIQEIESLHDLTIVVSIDSAVLPGHFNLYKTGEDGREILHQEQDDDRNSKRKGRGRRGGRNRRRREEGEEGEDAIAHSASADHEYDNDEENSKESNDDTAEPQEDDQRVAAHAPRQASDRPDRPRRANTRANHTGGAEQLSGEAAGEKAAEGGSSNRPRRRNRRRANTRRPMTDGTQTSQSDGVVSSPAPAEASVSRSDDAAPAAPAASEANQGASPASSKRKGWWNRVVQGAESDG